MTRRVQVGNVIGDLDIKHILGGPGKSEMGITHNLERRLGHDDATEGAEAGRAGRRRVWP